ncbi:hypothetical protein ACIHQR_10390 [Corallococcus coralloides]|uniref:hypothetical protein n=1 Tax=Corallococcus coralloides TaxID=184914 RepID=UPI0038517572
MRAYKLIKFLLPPEAIHLPREIVSLNNELQRDIEAESALKEKMKELSIRAIAVRDDLLLMISSTESKIKLIEHQISRSTENTDLLKDELHLLLQEQARNRERLIEWSTLNSEGARLEEGMTQSINRLSKLKKRVRKVALKNFALILLGTVLGIALQGPLTEKYIPLYIEWIKHAGIKGQAAGALSIATTGYLLFLLRSNARRIYAALELLFSMSAGWLSIVKIQTIGDTASFLQGAAAVYLFVRGFDNLTEGQRLLMERHDEHERNLAANRLAPNNGEATAEAASPADVPSPSQSP